MGISIVRDYTERVKPPRTVFVRWPFGHPLGEAFHRAQQAVVLDDALKALAAIEVPGTIVDLPYPWRRHRFAAPPWLPETPV